MVGQKSLNFIRNILICVLKIKSYGFGNNMRVNVWVNYAFNKE